MRRNQLLPWNAFTSFDKSLGRLFEAADGGAPTSAPLLDVVEGPEAFRVTADLPGVVEDDVKISLEEGVLDLVAERRSEERAEGEELRHVERRVQRFRRRLSVPGEIDADAVEATLENGVLTIVLPKAERAKPHQIEVRRKG